MEKGKVAKPKPFLDLWFVVGALIIFITLCLTLLYEKWNTWIIVIILIILSLTLIIVIKALFK